MTHDMGKIRQVLTHVSTTTGSCKAQNLLGAGDALLLLVKKHLTDGMHMSEQTLTMWKMWWFWVGSVAYLPEQEAQDMHMSTQHIYTSQ